MTGIEPHAARHIHTAHNAAIGCTDGKAAVHAPEQFIRLLASGRTAWRQKTQHGRFYQNTMVEKYPLKPMPNHALRTREHKFGPKLPLLGNPALVPSHTGRPGPVAHHSQHDASQGCNCYLQTVSNHHVCLIFWDLNSTSQSHRENSMYCNNSLQMMPSGFTNNSTSANTPQDKSPHPTLKLQPSGLANTLSIRLPSRSTTSKCHPAQSTFSPVPSRRPDTL